MSEVLFRLPATNQDMKLSQFTKKPQIPRQI